MYVCIDVCMHKFMCVYVYIYTHIHVYIYMYTCVSVYVCTFTWISVYILSVFTYGLHSCMYKGAIGEVEEGKNESHKLLGTHLFW